MSATTSATQPILTPPNETVEVTVQRSNPWTNRRARTAIAVCVFTLVIDTSTVSAMDASRIEDLEVRACVARTVPDYSMTQRLDVQMLDDDGAISESSGYLSWKRFEDGRAKLVVSIVAPPERAGVAVLLIEREGANPDVFMYIPERRQVRPVGARTLGASMLGTDLSYEDFTHFQQMVDTGIATRLDDVTLDGHPVYVLENIPVDGKSRLFTHPDLCRSEKVPAREDGVLRAERLTPQSALRRAATRAQSERPLGPISRRNAGLQTRSPYRPRDRRHQDQSGHP